MTALESYAKARAAEDAINTTGRDPTDYESNEATTMLARAYRSTPASFAEIAALAALVLHAEDAEPSHRLALESIRGGAEVLAKSGKYRTGIDPAIERCEAARKVESALRRILSKREGTADDLAQAEAALHAAYATHPISPTGIAALAGLTLYVEGNLLEPEVAVALKTIRRGADKIVRDNSSASTI